MQTQGQMLCNHRQLTFNLHVLSTYQIPFDSLEGHFKVLKGLVVCNPSIGQDKSTQTDLSADLSIFGKNDLVEMRGHSNVRWVSNDFVANPPLAICLFLGQIQRPSYNTNRRITSSKSTAKVLKVSPVVSVESLADLRTHVAQSKRIIHGLLRPLSISSRNLMASVIATAEVVLELRAELFGYGVVLDKDGVFAVCIAVLERLGGDVLDNPRRVSGSAVVGRGQGRGGSQVGHRARESVLVQSIGVDGSGGSGESFLDSGRSAYS
jgi:hypothetical protein